MLEATIRGGIYDDGSNTGRIGIQPPLTDTECAKVAEDFIASARLVFVTSEAEAVCTQINFAPKHTEHAEDTYRRLRDNLATMVFKKQGIWVQLAPCVPLDAANLSNSVIDECDAYFDSMVSDTSKLLDVVPYL